MSAPMAVVTGGRTALEKSAVNKVSKIPRQTVGRPSRATGERQQTAGETTARRPGTRGQDGPTGTSSWPRASVSTLPASNRRRVLENQFTTRKKNYITLRRDVVDKQKSSEAAFEELLQLRKKIVASGGRDPGPLEQLLPAPSLSMAGRSAAVLLRDEFLVTDDADLIDLLEAELRALPEPGLALARESVDGARALGDWLATDREAWPREEAAGLLEKLFSGSLRERLDALSEELHRRVDALTQRVRCLWHESQLLRREREEAQAETGDYADLERELHEEREKLGKARARERELEAAAAGAEARLRQSQEAQRQLKITLEQRSKELGKCQRTEHQKDTVETRVNKLKEELGRKVEEHRSQVQSLEQELQSEREQRRELENQFEHFRTRNAKLEEKCKQLLEMRQQPEQVPPDDQPSEHEVQLFNDLKETKAQLAERDEIILIMQAEQERIAAAVTEIDQENDSSQKKLSSELMRTSNELQTVKAQLAQLQKSYVKTQQNSEFLEQKLADMNQVQAQVRDSTGGKLVQVTQLQHQLTDACTSLHEARERSVELEKVCVQQEVQLEHYKRYVRNLHRDLKLRKEMQQLLRNEDGTVELQSASTDEQLSAEDFPQLQATLEAKELQLRKLEKLVKQMEKQEEYAQTQRTRLESRIAELEFTLRENRQANRNRGFSFL